MFCNVLIGISKVSKIDKNISAIQDFKVTYSKFQESTTKKLITKLENELEKHKDEIRKIQFNKQIDKEKRDCLIDDQNKQIRKKSTELGELKLNTSKVFNKLRDIKKIISVVQGKLDDFKKTQNDITTGRSEFVPIGAWFGKEVKSAHFNDKSRPIVDKIFVSKDVQHNNEEKDYENGRYSVDVVFDPGWGNWKWLGGSVVLGVVGIGAVACVGMGGAIALLGAELGEVGAIAYGLFSITYGAAVLTVEEKALIEDMKSSFGLFEKKLGYSKITLTHRKKHLDKPLKTFYDSKLKRLRKEMEILESIRGLKDDYLVKYADQLISSWKYIKLEALKNYLKLDQNKYALELIYHTYPALSDEGNSSSLVEKFRDDLYRPIREGLLDKKTDIISD